MLVSTSWDESDPRPSPMTQYTFSIQDLARRDDHRDKYNNFIKYVPRKQKSDRWGSSTGGAFVGYSSMPRDERRL